eukprot:158269_1
MDHSNNPTMIEEEPSHELYLNIIGKDSAKISPNSSTTTLRTQFSSSRRGTSTGNSASIRTPTIIPSNDYQTKTTKPNIDFKNKNSFASVYRRALSSSNTHNSYHSSQLSLDRKNKGYQILTKLGFKERDGGLGKNRQGGISPVKTILKFDKRGLGSGKRSTPKVTHHQHTTLKSTPDVNVTLNKKETKGERKRRLKKEMQTEQMKEKRARMMINSELSDEYGVFLGLN